MGEKQHPSLVGYARVSNVGQNLEGWVDSFLKRNCQKIFQDKATGSRMDRPGWDALMGYLRKGDTLVVTELSRMTRSLTHLLETTKALIENGIRLISLQENNRHYYSHRSLLPLYHGSHLPPGAGTQGI